MTTTINASNSGSGGLLQAADATGILALQTAGTSAVTINTLQNVTLNSTGALTVPTGTTDQRPATPVEGMFRYNSTTYAVEAYMRGSWIVIGSNPISIPTEYLVVAGGGGGGQNGGGGGGAGGLLYSSNTIFQTNIIYTVTIGAGGAGAVTPGGYGANSSIVGSSFGTTSVTATGGGGGASRSGGNATNGGSGGGGGDALDSATFGPGTGIVGPPRQGYNGGTSTTTNNGGAGGGGAGAAGANPSGGVPTAGGVGLLYPITVNFIGTASTSSNTTLTITAVSAGVIGVGTQVTGSNIPASTFIVRLGTGTGGVGTYIMNSSATTTTTGVAITSTGAYYAGGGGGGRCPGLGSDQAAGGAGGGGASVAQSGPSIAGATNTGGGGGGGGATGAEGGSGVVIIKYADTYQAATSTTGSPTITVAGGYRIYKFTGSGSITI
jgi:hypothetical protein